MVTRVVAGRTYDFSHAMGRGAVAGMGFNYGNAMTIDPEGMVYVVSRGAEFVTGVPWNRTARGARVGKFDVGLQSGEEEYHGDFGKTGDGYGEFTWPTGVALDTRGTIYVTDEWLNKVSVWDGNWELVTEWGVVGSGEGEFDGPSGIICDADDNLLVVDSRNHRVQRLHAGRPVPVQFWRARHRRRRVQHSLGNNPGPGGLYLRGRQQQQSGPEVHPRRSIRGPVRQLRYRPG